MSRRKTFHAGEGALLIADEFAQEVYIGIAAIQVGQTNAGQMDAAQEDAKQADAEAAPRKPIRVETLATVLMGPVFVTLAFSLGAIVVGIVLARAWRWVGN